MLQPVGTPSPSPRATDSPKHRGHDSGVRDGRDPTRGLCLTDPGNRREQERHQEPRKFQDLDPQREMVWFSMRGDIVGSHLSRGALHGQRGKHFLISGDCDGNAFALYSSP